MVLVPAASEEGESQVPVAKRSSSMCPGLGCRTEQDLCMQSSGHTLSGSIVAVVLVVKHFAVRQS